jgi:hypothetical protein
MPIPVYLICSESGAHDEATKLASFFNLVEKLRIARVEAIPGQIQVIQITPLRLSALWVREEGDEDSTFEVQFVGLVPNAPQEIELARTTFLFTDPFQRVTINGLQLNQFYGPGLMFFEARLRPEGEPDWQTRMRYPVIL